MKLSLMGKILFGVAVLLVPLALTLTSVVQFGSTTIRVAEGEATGLAVSSPVLDAALLWQIGGPDRPADEKLRGQMDDYLTLLSQHPEMNINEASLKASGYGWMDPTALREAQVRGAGGDLAQFAAVEDRLLDQVAALADASSLVLDPDIDSYYLMLGIYDSLPKMLSEITSIRVALGTGQALPAARKIDAAAGALNLKKVAGHFVAQVSRSISTDSSSHGPVPGFGDKVNPMLVETTRLTTEVNSLVTTAVNSPTSDGPGLEAQLAELVVLLDEFHDVGLEVLGAMLQARIDEAFASLMTALVSALVSLLVGFVVLFWILLDLRSRVRVLVQTLGAVASGDLTTEVPARALRSRDELGRLAVSVKSLREALRAQVSQIETTSASLALIGSNLGANSEQSAAAIEQMSATSAQVARFAGQQSLQTGQSGQSVESILQKISQANDLTANMAAQFFMFGQSMEANRRRIQATALEAQHAGELAATLSRTGEQGARSLEALNLSITTVVQRTTEIQEVVQIILDIADRSSLLSMNAAIEAAHAGSSGRGFAVVAEEIRKMAETSTKQAQTIKTLLDGITEAAEITRARSQATAASFQSLNEDIQKVSEAGLSISGQMEMQEAEDGKLSEGLIEFTNFYALLAESMSVQMAESQQVKEAIGQLQGASQEISESMSEQKIGMEQATEAVIQVRETAMNVATIIQSLRDEVARFRLE